MAQTFWFLAVFESLRSVDVKQDSTDYVLSQAVSQKWSRAGVVDIRPGQPTESVVEQVVATCRENGEIPPDALLISVQLLPNQLVPR